MDRIMCSSMEKTSYYIFIGGFVGLLCGAFWFSWGTWAILLPLLHLPNILQNWSNPIAKRTAWRWNASASKLLKKCRIAVFYPFFFLIFTCVLNWTNILYIFSLTRNWLTYVNWNCKITNFCLWHFCFSSTSMVNCPCLTSLINIQKDEGIPCWRYSHYSFPLLYTIASKLSYLDLITSRKDWCGLLAFYCISWLQCRSFYPIKPVHTLLLMAVIERNPGRFTRNSISVQWNDCRNWCHPKLCSGLIHDRLYIRIYRMVCKRMWGKFMRTLRNSFLEKFINAAGYGEFNKKALDCKSIL